MGENARPYHSLPLIKFEKFELKVGIRDPKLVLNS